MVMSLELGDTTASQTPDRHYQLATLNRLANEAMGTQLFAVFLAIAVLRFPVLHGITALSRIVLLVFAMAVETPCLTTI